MAFKTAAMIAGTVLLSMGILYLLASPTSAQGIEPPENPIRIFRDAPGEKVMTQLEKRLISEGLVNVRELDPSIIVDLKYASPDNFMGASIYDDFNEAYLRPEAAKKLARASQILQRRFPNLRIFVGDALRPRSVQRKMWALVEKTPMQRYVADPSRGSMHNYGAAVDVTLFDMNTGEEVDMGTPLDYFGPLAQPALEADYLNTGELTREQYGNRIILRNAMRDAGWHVLRIEWWHFNAFPKDFVRRNYSIIE